MKKREKIFIFLESLSWKLSWIISAIFGGWINNYYLASVMFFGLVVQDNWCKIKEFVINF